MERAHIDLLVIKAQKGDPKAFERLFSVYNAALRRFAYRLCGDEALAVDAVQDAWITLSRTLSKLKDPRGFRIWAYKTVRWRVMDQLRRRGPPGTSGEAVEEMDIAVAHEAPEIATSDQLAAHMAALPRAEKAALTLFYLEELSLMEIAGIEGVPLGTVKSRLNRARTRLRDSMTGDER